MILHLLTLTWVCVMLTLALVVLGGPATLIIGLCVAVVLLLARTHNIDKRRPE